MAKRTIRVLVIEDNAADAILIRASLSNTSRLGWDLPSFEISHVRCLREGLARLSSDDLDIILLDLDLPDSSAERTFERLQQHTRTLSLPIVVLTGREDMELARKTVRAGAEDYLFKREMSGPLLARVIVNALERRSAQRAVHRQQALVRQVMDLVPYPIFVKDYKGRFLLVNQAGADFAGLTVEQMQGHLESEWVTDVAVQRAIQSADQKVIESGESCFFPEEQFFDAQGHNHIMQTTKIPFQLRDDEPMCLLGISIDITELRRAEEAYRTLVNHSLQGLCILQEGRVVFVNKTLAEMFGYTVEEILSFSSPEALSHLAPLGRDFVERQRQARESGAPVDERYEIQVYTKSGEVRWTEQFVGAVLYQGQPALQIAVVDITERKKAQNALADSLQQKDVLLREIHHRVKNNLAVAASMLQLQVLESADPELEAILTRSQERLFAMGRVHEHLYRTRDLRSVDMRSYLGSLIAHLQSSLGRRDINLMIDIDPLKLDLDIASPCGLIVNELVTNAFKHAFPKIATDGAAAQYEIQVKLRQEGDTLTLTVSDNGVGLDPDVLSKPSLGIQLVQLLVSNLHGTFRTSASPDYGTGTTFSIRFEADDVAASS